MPTSDGGGSHLFSSNPVHHHHRRPTKRTVKCKCFRMCIFCFHSTADTVAKCQNIGVWSTNAQVSRVKNAMQTKMIIITVILFFLRAPRLRERAGECALPARFVSHCNCSGRDGRILCFGVRERRKCESLEP